MHNTTKLQFHLIVKDWSSIYICTTQLKISAGKVGKILASHGQPSKYYIRMYMSIFTVFCARMCVTTITNKVSIIKICNQKSLAELFYSAVCSASRTTQGCRRWHNKYGQSLSVLHKEISLQIKIIGNHVISIVEC